MTDLNQAKLVAVTKKDLDDKWCLAFAATGTPLEVLRNCRWRDAMTATIQHAKARNEDDDDVVGCEDAGLLFSGSAQSTAP